MKSTLKLCALIVFALAGSLQVEAQNQYEYISQLVGDYPLFVILINFNGDGNMGSMQNGTPVGAPVRLPTGIGVVTENGFGDVPYGGMQIFSDVNGGPP